MPSSKPLELTADEFAEMLAACEDVPPCVPVDFFTPESDTSLRIKCSTLGCYPLADGRECEVLVFDDIGLILVSPAIWEMLQ